MDLFYLSVVCVYVSVRPVLSSQALLCVNAAKGHGRPLPRSRPPPALAAEGNCDLAEVKLLLPSSTDDRFIYLTESVGPSAQKPQTWVHQCVLSCFLVCTSLCCGSLVNIQLRGWSCSQDGPADFKNTVWLQKMTILLLRCLSCIVFYSETLKLNTLLIYSYYNYIDMHIYLLFGCAFSYCGRSFAVVKLTVPPCRNTQSGVKVLHSKFLRSTNLASKCKKRYQNSNYTSCRMAPF